MYEEIKTSKLGTREEVGDRRESNGFYPTFPCTIRMEENEGRRRTGSGGQFAKSLAVTP
jgi:hypothetical protein